MTQDNQMTDTPEAVAGWLCVAATARPNDPPYYSKHKPPGAKSAIPLYTRPTDATVRQLVAQAYRDGATDVHNAWENDEHSRDPDFYEAAGYYAEAALAAYRGQ